MTLSRWRANSAMATAPRSIGQWRQESSASRIYLGMGIYTGLFLTIAYMAYLPYSGDPLMWTLLILPIDITMTILLLTIGTIFKTQREGSYWRAFPFSFRDALRIIDTVMAESGMPRISDTPRYNWLILSRAKVVLRIENVGATVELYGSEAPSSAVYIRGFSAQTETKLRSFLMALDEASKPAALA